MKVKMLQSRNVNGQSAITGKEIEVDETKGRYLIARKEAKEVIEVVAEKEPEKEPEKESEKESEKPDPTPKTPQTKADVVNV